MSLRRRLWIVLAGLFFVPLVVGALVLLLVVPGARSDRNDDDASTASAAVRAELSDECVEVNLAVQVVALTAVAGTPAGAVAAVADQMDYAAVLGPDKTPLASFGALPAGAQVAELPQCSDRTTSSTAPVVAQRFAPQRGTTTGPTGVVAKRLDRELLDDIRQRGSTPGEIVLLAGDEVVLSTLGRDQTDAVVRATRDRKGLVDLDGWTARVAEPKRGVPWTTVVAVPDTGGSNNGLFALILLAGAVAAGALVTVVARNLSQPYAEITAAAERVASGDLDTSISATTEGDAGRLGSALNTMTDELRRSVAELERSRDDLRDSLERIGDTLSSTHDLDGLLQVVLDTAVVTLQARAGVVLHLQADRLQLVAEHLLFENGLPAPAAVTPGTGVLGRVALHRRQRARPARVGRRARRRRDRAGSGRRARGAAAQHGQRRRRRRALRPPRRPQPSSRRTRTPCARWPTRRASRSTTSTCTTRPSGCPPPTRSPACGTSATCR